MKHTDARTTLARIDATLRLTDTQLWHDPEFLAWERGQVDDRVDTVTDGDSERALYSPGPQHWLYDISLDVGVDDTVTVAPMATLLFDFANCACGRSFLPVPASACDGSNPMRITAADYPPPEHTTHGPLLLDTNQP